MANSSSPKKDLKYFMRDKTDEIVTVPGPDTFRDEDGNVINLEIRVLSNAEIQKINDSYRKRKIAVDKKNQPYIANGEVVFQTERDNARASRHIIAEALVYPDLKDPELMAFYDCHDITEMPNLVFRTADEYACVSRAVMTALGLMDAPPDDDVLEEAKN